VKISEQSQPISVITKVILLLGANISMMAGASLSPVMPQMMAEFADVPGVEFWISMVITLPTLFVVLGGPLIGYLTDRFGRKPVLVLSIALGGLSGSAAYFLNSIGAILITRALVGLGIAGSLTATNALMSDYFEGQQRARFMGLHSAVSGLAGIFFLPLGGFLADVHWRLAFFAYLPLLVLFPLAMRFIREAQQTSEKEILGDERLRIDLTKTFIFASAFFTHLAFITIPVYIAYYSASVLNASGTAVGLIGAASSLFSFFAGYLYERIGRKLNFKVIAVAGFFLFAIGFIMLGFAGSWAPVILAQLILGFCMGMSNSNFPTWLSKTVSPRVRGRANGIYVTIMSLGPFVGSFVFAPVVTRFSYSHAYLFSGMIFLVMGIAAFFVRYDHSVDG
jgi:MFS family permease